MWSLLLILILAKLVGLACMYNRANLRNWTLAASGWALVSWWIAGFGLLAFILLALPVIGLAIAAHQPSRLRFISKPIMGRLKGILPQVSQTEQAALDAGTVGWDGDLFSGQPDFARLRATKPRSFTAEEQAFLDGPVADLCDMLDDWDIRARRRDLPPEIWAFLKQHGFLGMIIPKQYGGLGFTPHAQSEVVSRIASRSGTAAVTVMVPNSLGPGELLSHYGTEAQKQHYLPRLAKGEDIPCFALTGEQSGSDAAAMRDIGIVTYGQHEGEEVLGIRVSWDKRYITLAPVATVLGLAFYLRDPDGLLGGEEDIGISVALVPRDHPGCHMGYRHDPAGGAFMNGPTWGRDVFIPMDFIIGGEARLGEGWRMLMEQLAVGRAISLPASGTTATKSALRVTSAYARIRRQFELPVGRMEGVALELAEIAADAYALESARSLTNAFLTEGQKPSVISAMFKYQATTRMRHAIDRAMDIHGGKGICDGPSNYLFGAYQAVPVAITVEGANILTRTLITFAQGSLRGHPYLLQEIDALREDDLEAFDEAFVGHAGWMFANLARSFIHNLTFGRFVSLQDDVPQPLTGHYKQLARSVQTFALLADMVVVIYGGGLKARQGVSGRMADAFSELYLMSAGLKYWEDLGSHEEDLPLLDYVMQRHLYAFQQAIKGVTENMPQPFGWYFGKIAFPLGAHRKPPKDRLAYKVSQLVQVPGEQRDRLTPSVVIARDNSQDVVAVLERALVAVHENEDLYQKAKKGARALDLRDFHDRDWFQVLVENKVLTGAEADTLRDIETMVHQVVAVDRFTHNGFMSGQADGFQWGDSVLEGRELTKDDQAQADKTEGQEQA